MATRGGWGDGGGAVPAAGLRALVPGYAQWSRRHRERGAVLFGTFTAAAGAAVFAWGTPAGLAVLAYAFATHAVSTTDAVRHGSFPAAGRWSTRVGVPGGLAVAVYAPLLAAASLFAWPGTGAGGSPDGYLVNRRAYRRSGPTRGHWIYYRPGPADTPRAGRVVAAQGQEVDWSAAGLRVDGRPVGGGGPFGGSGAPGRLTYRVPHRHSLVEPAPHDAGPREPGGLTIVPHDRVIGRAWARFYPVWDRRLLP